MSDRNNYILTTSYTAYPHYRKKKKLTITVAMMEKQTIVYPRYMCMFIDLFKGR